MKRDFYQLVAVFATCACTLFCSSCAPKQELQKDIISPSYVFDKNKAVGFSRVEEFITSDVTLDLGDVMANFVLPQLKFSEEDIFVSSMTEVLRFGYDGKLKNKIGCIGHASNEYEDLNDWCYDPTKNMIEILGPKKIYKYDITGEFIGKQDIDISATSFTKANGYYWFSTGRNGYDKYTVFRTDEKLNEAKGYLEAEATRLPIKENNFGKGTILTYKESFSHTVYKIQDGDLLPLHAFLFEGLEIPNGLLKGEMMEIIGKMAKTPFATIHTYLENENYIFIQAQEYLHGIEDDPISYWWTIDKKNGNNFIFTVLPEDIELYGNPQILTNENILYCVGYPKQPETDNPDNANIPHLVGIDLSALMDSNQ